MNFTQASIDKVVYLYNFMKIKNQNMKKMLILAVVMMATSFAGQAQYNEVRELFPEPLFHDVFVGPAGMIHIVTLEDEGTLYWYRPEGQADMEIFFPRNPDVPAQIWSVKIWEEVQLIPQKRARRMLLRHVRRCSR